ncbi:unnamed protein product [Hymenolepis diminuta]|uniref:Uncharacterized protein n=1 Tax=Hymenolepis diminuta TaxID=6216 RepID=A0A564Y6B8_HYMDI|nr:unnamed protein product [Hymenolepis diminuta]
MGRNEDCCTFTSAELPNCPPSSSLQNVLVSVTTFELNPCSFADNFKQPEEIDLGKPISCSRGTVSKVDVENAGVTAISN